MILFSTHNSPRLQYMAHWLGHRLTGKPLQIVHDATTLSKEDIVLNYSGEQLAVPAFHMAPHPLLFETGIRQQSVVVSSEATLPVFFQTPGTHYPFDIMAASFFLLSRYEEYYSGFALDEYGRYSHTNSLAWQQGFLKRPLVDEWILDLREKLSQHFPGLPLKQQQPGFLPTLDVDLAWSYRHKGWWRNIGGSVRDLQQGHWSQVPERIGVLSGFLNDPFAVLEDYEEAHRYFGLPTQLFFLLAAENKGYDKNIAPRKKALQQLMRWFHRQALVGIHFSWAASQEESIMKAEKAFMDQVLQTNVQSNRMHYVNFTMPRTFRQLLEAGITSDYSMGYGTINGFRAGTSQPYAWYDLEREESTALELFPFAWMDANSLFEQKDSPENALAELQSMYAAVQQTGGLFITICHNHLTGHDKRGRQWWSLYMKFLQANFNPAPASAD